VSCSLYAGALFKARRVLNLDAFGAAFSRKGFIGSLAARSSARS